MTGYYGPSTVGAAREFQQKNDLAQGGNVDKETRSVLYSIDAVRKIVIATPADDYMAVSIRI